ncbi:sensor histidine kinase [Streptacidiphilus sp. P02-A3a]|uniref:sensor histidine kinase n=1 Tax=Streptacidiphilus sp. P02-A3a TaxID=2704468 RepID=UPI0015F7C57B|nr:sensor histidine kinase [Streptacidiphilus sp. P02-A3a]QMU69842.1 sensor histidine kinase [Streptacidiphilus sp. P02-A3a]
MSRPTWTSARAAVRRRRGPDRLPPRLRLRPPAVALDLALAAAFLAALLADRFGAAARIGGRMPLALALSVLIAAALGARRSAPLAGYLAGSAALSAEALFVLPSQVSPYANLVGLYSLGRYATRARARLGPVVVLLGMAAYFSGTGHRVPVLPAWVLFVWLLAWALGYGEARRQEEREAARRVLRAQVVADERVRIARELHDLVGHTLNVLLVQAGAARRLLDRDPERTRGLLGTMEHTGREALEELDRVLGLLRRDEPDLSPGLAQLGSLARRMEQAGIQVTARVDPAAYRLPRPLDLSAYRIVQEALTNTVKHGRAARAEVSVRRERDVLDVEVRDDGVGADPGCAPGRGLLGIAERAREFGGSVEYGAGERGGFRLHAVLPIPRAAEAVAVR